MAVEINEDEEFYGAFLREIKLNSPGKAPWPLLPYRFSPPLMSHANAKNTKSP